MSDKTKECSCPSGDGSLRWPCPVHPPEASHRAMNAASPTTTYTVERNRCDCHPETCCCHPWMVMDGAKRIASYYKRMEAAALVSLLNKNAVCAAPGGQGSATSGNADRTESERIRAKLIEEVCGMVRGQGSATTSGVKTYQQRIEEDPNFIGVRSKQHMFDYVLAEVADLRAALAAKAEQSNDDQFAQSMLAEVARMGASPAGLSLAVQLFGIEPCAACGYRKLHCRCPAPVAERAAAPASVLTEALNALLERIDDAAESYERHGAICQFEGNPMLYAATLDEIITLRGEFHVASLAAPEVAPASVPEGWISVADRLPPTELLDDGNALMVLVKWKRESRADCLSDIDVSNALYLARNASSATHWMPLPADPAAPEVAKPAAQSELPTLPRPAKHGDIPKPWPYFTADQMQEWGASQRQEGRRAGIEEAAALYDTSPHAEEFRCNIAESIRVLAAPAPTAGEPSASEVMVAGHEFLKWNRAQTPPPVDGKELYIARKVLELRAAHIKATQGGKEGA